jgi:hypothetical protein
MDGTGATPLVAEPTGGYEVDQLQDLLHGDLVAKRVEIDAGHGRFFFDEWLDRSTIVPFPLIYREQGTIVSVISQYVAIRS